MWLGGDYDVSEETNENADSAEQRVLNKKKRQNKANRKAAVTDKSINREIYDRLELATIIVLQNWYERALIHVLHMSWILWQHQK